MQLPNPMGGIAPEDYLNWLAQMEAWRFQQESQRQRQQQQAGGQQFDFLTELIKDAQKQQANAQNANEGRYNDILQLYGVTRGDVLGDLEGFGQSQQADINRNWGTTRNNLMADLAARGMPGSTARIPIEASVNEGRGRQTMALQDMLRDRRSSTKERFADKAGGVMERRTDTYPSMNPVAQFAGQLGGMSGAMPSAPGNRVSPGAFGMGQFAQPAGPGALPKPNMAQAPTGTPGLGSSAGRPSFMGSNNMVQPGGWSPYGTANAAAPGGRPSHAPFASPSPFVSQPAAQGQWSPYSMGGPPMLQRRPGTTPIESRGRAVRMPESGEPTFSYAGGAPGTQPQRPTIGPNMNDPANVRPNPAQLAMHNAYSPSAGLSGDRKFLVPSGMGGPGQQVPTVPGMVGGPIGVDSLMPMLPSPFPSFNYTPRPSAAPRQPAPPWSPYRKRLPRRPMQAGGQFPFENYGFAFA
jgi:hypothetical protein